MRSRARRAGPNDRPGRRAGDHGGRVRRREKHRGRPMLKRPGDHDDDSFRAACEAADERRRKLSNGPAGVSLDDFYAYMPMHSYIFVPSREPWPAASVNATIPPVTLLNADGSPRLDDEGEPKTIKPSTWLDQNRPVHQMTWIPGEPMIVPDKLVSDG